MADSQVHFETLLAQQQEFEQKLMQQQKKMDGIHSFTKQWFELSQIGRIIRVPAVSKL